MNDPLFFEIDARHFCRQLHPDGDRRAISALGERCLDYLRLALGPGFDSREVARVFPAMLKPVRVPTDRSVVFGIYESLRLESAGPAHLAGILYFLHPLQRSDTWFITLLLLEPIARGRGLGRAVHGAFETWAVARGARRFVVAIADNNPGAWRFWRARLDYQSIAPGSARWAGERPHRELEYRLNVPRVSAPAWRG